MSNLIVSNIEGTLVVDSRLVASELGIKHKTFMDTIRKYQNQIESAFGLLAVETEAVKIPGQRGVKNQKFYYLTEDQATFLMTVSRNTEQVIYCKINLVQAFSKAKDVIKTVIPQQSDRIKELELELAIAIQTNQSNQASLASRQLDHTMLTMHGRETVLALRGKEDQIVETEKPVIEIIDDRHNVKFKGQTLVQIKEYVKQKYGINFKSGVAIKRFLEEKGEGHLIAQTLRSITSEYVPDENLEQVYRLLKSDSRQLLLGE